jgi:hypothetical protein
MTIKFSKDHGDVLDRALAKHGETAQMDQAVEEFAELIKAIAKVHRHGRIAKTEFDMCDEIADAHIMLEQLTRLYFPEFIQNRVNYKIARLASRMEGSQSSQKNNYKLRAQRKNETSNSRNLSEQVEQLPDRKPDDV